MAYKLLIIFVVVWIQTRSMPKDGPVELGTMVLPLTLKPHQLKCQQDQGQQDQDQQDQGQPDQGWQVQDQLSFDAPWHLYWGSR